MAEKKKTVMINYREDSPSLKPKIDKETWKDKFFIWKNNCNIEQNGFGLVKKNSYLKSEQSVRIMDNFNMSIFELWSLNFGMLGKICL